MEHYFVILCTEDGNFSMSQYSKEELEHLLNSDYWVPNIKVFTTNTPSTTADDVPQTFKNIDLRQVPGLYIIKGALVAPKPKTVITQWEI